MSTSSLRLPESLHKRARELAKKENISMNQFIAAAVAEKMSSLLAGGYLEERAARGGRTRSRPVPLLNLRPGELRQLRAD